MTSNLVLSQNDSFRREAPRVLDMLKDGLRTGDLIIISRYAHELGGAARRMGAVKLQELCNDIEKQAMRKEAISQLDTVLKLDDLFAESLDQANKNALDMRLEAVEGSLQALQQSLADGLHSIKDMVEQHLAKQDTFMEQIVTASNTLKEAIDNNMEKMTDALIGRKQVPTSIFMLVIVFFAAMTLVDRIKDTNLDINIDMHGIHITRSTQAETSSAPPRS